MRLFLKTKDYSISGEEFELLHDEELDMIVTNPQPKNLHKYYESDIYISHTDSNKTLLDKMYQWVKKYSLKRKVGLIDSFSNSGKSLLDVGAGTGDFLLAAKRKGWSVNGVEPNELARGKATEKGINLSKNLESLQNQKFGIITLWHVLEHLPDLEDQIKKICSLLHEDGTLVIAVPNFKSKDAKHYGKFWAAYDVPRHLWHFSGTAIEKLFASHNLQLVKIRPMVFDAFYVSLLSEKYKTGKYNFIKAFFTGLRSNMAAWRSKEYSSRIYVLKRA